MNSQISILGTGWLGLPLATILFQKGYRIKASTTTPEKLERLKKIGLQPYLLSLSEKKVDGNFSGFLRESETLVVNIPPGLRSNPESNYVQKIKNLVYYFKKSSVKNLIYISSTSVFKDEEYFPIITEENLPNATSPSGKQLIEAENLLLNLLGKNITILRFGGLYDKRRHPATMIAKKGIIPNPLAPLNLIHRKDCVGIISKILTLGKYNITFNAAHPDHPKKKQYYQKVCKEMGLKIPIGEEKKSSIGKIIDSSFLVNQLDYVFRNRL